MVKSAIAFWCLNLCAFTLCSADALPQTAQNDCSQEPQEEACSAPWDYFIDRPFSKETATLAAEADEAIVAADPSIPAQSARPTQEDCGLGPRHNRISVRYTTPKGIGYNPGYTTLEGFFAPKNFWGKSWLPFLDVRGHVFDDGKLAANAGVGLRYLAKSRVWGVNSYYDYRNTCHQHYNQVSAGLESLGRIWDFRINGYLPVGWKSSPYFNVRFDSFAGNNMLIRYKRDFAMKGANAEVGLHVDHFKKAPLYFAGGTYYLTGKAETTWGGELRATVDLFDRYVRIEGNTSYDHFFKWIGQAQVSVNIPFGARNKVKQKGDQSCSKAMALQQRAVQHVDRFEIIPVGRQHIVSNAIDPATGLPYFFLFVDNKSHSLGTYESPFPTLLAAEAVSSVGDVIYVFPGDGTSTGMNMGIGLQDSQMLLGASTKQHIPTTFGTVTIPAQTVGLPIITSSSTAVVTLGNDNTISGFFISVPNTSSSNGILALNPINNFTATRNTIVATGADSNGIAMVDPSGQVFIAKSSFSGFSDTGTGNGDGIIIELDSGNSLANLSVQGCTFSNFSNNAGSGGGNAILVFLGGGTLESMNVSGCTFNNVTNTGSGAGSNGISALLDGGALGSMNVSGCAFNNFTNTTGTGGDGIFADLVSSSTIGNLKVSDCSFSNFSNPGGSAGGGSGVFVELASGSALTNYNLSGCSFGGFNTNASGVFAQVNGGAITNFNFSSNTFNNFNSSFAISSAINTGTVSNWNVFSNVFNNFNSSFAISNSFISGSNTNFNVSDCTFNSFSNSSQGLFVDVGGMLTNCTISNSAFNGILDSSLGVFITVSPGELSNAIVSNNAFSGVGSNSSSIVFVAESGSTALNVSNNTFAGSSSAGPAFGAHILAFAGSPTLCLEFYNNSATPVNNPVPYQFVQNSGTFNRTIGSDSSTNSGQIDITGSVGNPGTCSQ